MAAWRSARRQGRLASLEPRAGGPRPRKRPDARDRKIRELEKENRRLKACAQALVEVQEKVSRLLGIPLESEAKD